MKKNYIYLFLFLLLFSFSVKAKSIDHFNAVASSDIVLDDDINGSEFLAGNIVESSGNVSGVSFIAGNDIKFSGTSEYGVIAGNSINITGETMRDIVVAGNIINVDKTANLQRDAIILGSDIEFMGNTGRNMTVYGRKVSFKGAKILGNLKIYAEEISVDSDTIISGKLFYPKDANANISSHITNVEKTSPIQTNEDELISNLMSRLWSFMSIVFIFALLTLICPRLFEKIQEEYQELGFNKFVETFSRGLVFLIIAPILCLMLLMFPFGIPLSMIILGLYFLVIYLSTLVFGYLFGYKLWQKYLKSDINILLVGMLGYAILFTLQLIPIIGSIVKIICLFFGIGIITKLFVRKYV